MYVYLFLVAREFFSPRVQSVILEHVYDEVTRALFDDRVDVNISCVGEVVNLILSNRLNRKASVNLPEDFIHFPNPVSWQSPIRQKRKYYFSKNIKTLSLNGAA